MADLRFSGNAIDKIMVGVGEASKVYHGSTLLWSSAPPFTPVTMSYTSGSGTVTAPAGATNVRIRAVGGGGQGEDATRFQPNGSPGAGSGAYVESNYSITSGETLNYAVGPGGLPTRGGRNGGDSTVTSGTKTITTMTAGGGGQGSSSLPGDGGVASGGNSQNTNGNAGATSATPAGGLGGASLYSGYGKGGDGASPDGIGPVIGENGVAGWVEFYFT